jgi:carbon storage regulator
MLVLTRHEGEEIYIDYGYVKIVVLKCTKGRVRIGIEAPKDLPVDKKEVALMIMERAAAEGGRA